MNAKACFKCGRVLPLSEYYRHRAMRDGHLNKCKRCTRADVQSHREAHRERHRLQDRMNYFAGKQIKPRERARRLATVAVYNAKRRGKLVKPEHCQRCGVRAVGRELQAHHHDYSQRLLVTWLCRVCHGKEHRMDPERRLTGSLE